MGFARKDAVLAAQAQNFGTVLAADPVVYAQTSAIATQVTAAVDAYISSLNLLTEARANGVRSEQQTAAKNFSRLSMLNLLRPIYASVQNSVSISGEAKIALGVLVKSTHPTPQPAPDFAPLLSVVKVNGSVVTLRMANPSDPSSNARPTFTAGISLFSAVSAEVPTDPSAFKFECNIGRVQTDVTFSASVETGATVWFCASYFSNRKESGPICVPISAKIGAGSVMPPMAIKIAA